MLWRGLIAAWQISDEEVRYINRQQGFYCLQCGNNLRMMALAFAVTRHVGFNGSLAELCDSGPSLRLLEINEAGFLTQFLARLPGHRLVEFPQYDMSRLELDSGQFDIVVHSDSLEHIAFPETALCECRRMLAEGGACIFTVPIVVGRLTRSRAGLAPIHHGSARERPDDQLVHTEFGADAWQLVLKAGFRSCEIVALEYPAALALVARG